ncbi:hypothetical protein Ae717Ps2_6360c [Pseudonocardia sp. Ae717_Ps2]|nr:hypothetical protein Ae717Ps2_6360c [Pseudonocardia sp. Ae717_Ps2]
MDTGKAIDRLREVFSTRRDRAQRHYREKSHPNILMHFIFASKMTKNTISARVSLPLFSLCVNRCVVLPIDTSGICCAP